MADDTTISHLLSYRVARLAGSLSRSAAARYRREFDVSLGEWRVLALLGENPDVTLNRLARRAALDKAQMSKVVSKLDARGLVRRVPGPRRSTQLSLTAAGEEVYGGLIAAANARNRRLMDAVPAGKLRTFLDVMDILQEYAAGLERAESDAAAGAKVDG